MKMANVVEIVLNATLPTPNLTTTSPSAVPATPFGSEPPWSVGIRWVLAAAIFLVGK